MHKVTRRRLATASRTHVVHGVFATENTEVPRFTYAVKAPETSPHGHDIHGHFYTDIQNLKEVLLTYYLNQRPHHGNTEYRGIFHGTYRDEKSLVPPNTSIDWYLG